MGLDSATVANVGILSTLTPSTPLIILVLGIAFFYIVFLLVKNTDITKAVAKSLESHVSMASTINEIRDDQVKSNKERKEQGIKISDIDQRLTQVEFDLLSLTRYQRTIGNK